MLATVARDQHFLLFSGADLRAFRLFFVISLEMIFFYELCETINFEL